MSCASVSITDKPIKDSLPGIQTVSPEPISEKTDNNSIKPESIRVSSPPSGWKELQVQFLEPVMPEQKPKPEKAKKNVNVVHGFKLYREGEEFLLHVPPKVKSVENQQLYSSIRTYFSRTLGKPVKIGTADGYTYPCTEVNTDGKQSTRELCLLLSFEKYNAQKIENEYFLKEFFRMVHARMMNENYEIAIPNGSNLTNWIIRDFVRYLGRLDYDLVRDLINRIPIKQRSYATIRFHDFEKFKSVLSTDEWRIITNGSLDDTIKSCQDIKSSIVKFKAADYKNFCASNAKIALEIFGKASISQVYERLKERRLLKQTLTHNQKAKAEVRISLNYLLGSLRKKGIYAGVHLMPAILKFRRGDLPILQRITSFQEGILIGNDNRFTSVEDYLKFAMNNPIGDAEASRVVYTDLSVGNFPTL